MGALKLIENIHTLFTANSYGTELNHAYVLIDDNVIEELGEGTYDGEVPDKVYDGSHKVMIPGLVNTHHHLYQTLFRNFKPANNSKLFDWLTTLYDRWELLNHDAIYSSTMIGLAELLSSGVTTTSDHLYVFPGGNNDFFDTEVEVAERVGIRFHPTRGSMSLSREEGGLPPKEVVQTEEEILSEYERVIDEFHDPDRFSMIRVALAPCSPFSVSEKLMQETAEMARKHRVLLHTHLAETEDENDFCLEKVGLRPVDYMEKLGWLGNDVWFAHLVHLTDDEIVKLSKARVGMSYCPSSNMRLGSGIAPVTKMKGTNLNISVAVDGSASNDSSNMIKELRQGLLLQRVEYGADAISPRDMLRFGSIGGARVLGRQDEIGSIEPGKAADLVMVDLNRLEFAGGLSDPVSLLLLCDTKGVDFTMVNGEVLVHGGNLMDESILEFVPKQNEIAARFY